MSENIENKIETTFLESEENKKGRLDLIIIKFKEKFKLKEECGKKGHPHSTVYSSDPLRRKVRYRCLDCKELYEKPMTYMKEQKAAEFMNRPTTI